MSNDTTIAPPSDDQKLAHTAPPVPPEPEQWNNSDCLKIFLSHKSTDAIFVAKIKEGFEDIDKKRVSVFTSPDVKNAGRDYRKAIAEHLQQSHCVILLYSDDKEQWDWPLYECGYFHGRHTHFDNADTDGLDSAPYTGRRLFIIHPAGVPRPDPLENWGSIAIIKENVRRPADRGKGPTLRKCLEKLFFETCFDLSRPISGTQGKHKKNQLDDLCAPFFDAMEGYRETPRFIPPWIRIEYPSPPRIEVKKPSKKRDPGVFADSDMDTDLGDLPPGTRVSSTDQRALDIFSTTDGAEWREVHKAMKGRLGKAWTFWSSSLADALGEFVQTRRVETSALPLLRKRKDDSAVCRPVIGEVSRRRDGMWIFTILLADIGSELERLPDDALGDITRSIWLTRMFAYGVVENYGRQLEELLQREFAASKHAAGPKEEEWLAFFVAFRHAINRVYAEAFNIGYVRERVAKLLSQDEDEFWRQVKAWEECEAEIASLDKKRLEERKEACLHIFYSMKEMALTVYKITGRRLAEQASNVKLRFGDRNGGDGPRNGDGIDQLPQETGRKRKPKRAAAREGNSRAAPKGTNSKP